MRYPQVLDYYFSLVEISFPSSKDDSVRSPTFGIPGNEPKQVKARRDSVDPAKGKRRSRKGSRGRTPPPAPDARDYR